MYSTGDGPGSENDLNVRITMTNDTDEESDGGDQRKYQSPFVQSHFVAEGLILWTLAKGLDDQWSGSSVLDVVTMILSQISEALVIDPSLLLLRYAKRFYKRRPALRKLQTWKLDTPFSEVNIEVDFVPFEDSPTEGGYPYAINRTTYRTLFGGWRQVGRAQRGEECFDQAAALAKPDFPIVPPPRRQDTHL